MGWFKVDEEREEVLDQLRSIRKELIDLKAEREVESERARLEKSINDLKREVNDVQIQKARLTEDHDREVREVKHMVGLEKKRQAVEIEQAKKETALIVREENLAADKKRFEEHLQFMERRFSDEVGYLKELMTEIMTRLPTVSVERNIEEVRRLPVAKKA